MKEQKLEDGFEKSIQNNGIEMALVLYSESEYDIITSHITFTIDILLLLNCKLYCTFNKSNGFS